MDMPAERNQLSSPSPFQVFDQNSRLGLLEYVSGVINVVVVSLLWVSSTLMLHQYSQRLGRIKFWGIVTVPLVFFVIEPSPLLFASIPHMLGMSSSNISLYVTMLYTVLPGVLGGFLFGAPFLVIARSIPENIISREYLIITAWGFIFFNVTTSGTIVNAPYLPFGFATVLLVGAACYFILVGLYSSAISIAGDTNLRQLIRRSVLDKSKLLDSIGSGHMQQEIVNTVMKIAKEQQQTLAEQTGVQSSLNEEDMKQYLEQVIEEVKKPKMSNDRNDA
jgi:hypothetical protein